MTHQRRPGILRNFICRGLIISGKITIYIYLVQRRQSLRLELQCSCTRLLYFIVFMSILFNEHSFSACLGNKSFVTFSSTHFTLTTFPSRQHRYHNLNSHSLFGYVSVNSFFLPFSFYFFFLPFAWIHQFKSNLTVSPCSLSLNAYIPQASALLLFSPNSKVVPLALHTNIFFSFHFLHRFLLCPWVWGWHFRDTERVHYLLPASPETSWLSLLFFSWPPSPV